MGGIYFDTDMIITKDISHLLNDETFLGVEDSMMVNAAVWGTSKPKTELAKRVLDFYKSQKHFDIDNIYKISIPRIITRILDEYGFDPSITEPQILNKNIHIYPRPYFYPLSFNYKNNMFDENTCMIHYFDATWIPKNEQREMKMIRKIGERPTRIMLNSYRFVKRNTRRAVKLCLFPAVLYRRYKRKISDKYFKSLKIADLILEKNIKQVVFSAMCLGWKELAIYLKQNNPDIKIKVFWHGNHSQVSEPYGWARNIEIIELHKQGIIDVFATCKQSLIDFYKKEGYKTKFITNTVVLPEKIKGERPKDKTVKIGIYAAKCDDWRKNMFAQLAAASLIPNAVVDMVPLNPEAKKFANSIGLKLEGLDKPIPRDELFKRMSNNTINLYVTFSECAPMLPIESFEVGVPCIFGNNHHYLKENELEKYLIVNNEESPIEIAKQIKNCLDNEKKVVELYKIWKKENDKQCREDVKEFLSM